MEKGGGGYFERVRSVQTTLTRIFIALESVSHGLHKNWDEICRKARKFKRLFRPKSDGLKKKKVLTDFETEFSAEISNSKVFFAQNQVVSKKKKQKTKTKKRSSPILRLIFRPNSEIQTFEGGLFSYGGGGGYFQFFTKNRPQNNQKGAILHTSQTNAPPPPPGYATGLLYFCDLKKCPFWSYYAFLLLEPFKKQRCENPKLIDNIKFNIKFPNPFSSLYYLQVEFKNMLKR